jgi:hypothetical protein
MPVEQRGLTGSIAAVRGKENRLEEIPTTEQRLHIEALKKQASGDGRRYLRPGIDMAGLQQLAQAQSDTEAAIEMQRAKKKLFAGITSRSA